MTSEPRARVSIVRPSTELPLRWPARSPTRRPGGRPAGQETAQLRQRRAQVVAVHDHVDHAVREQVLGALEAFGQLLADGLLDDARAGEADERPGLGDVHVAQHGIGGSDAAGGGVGQHDDVGQARLAQLLHGDGGARHLHQRQDALLHARARRRPRTG